MASQSTESTEYKAQSRGILCTVSKHTGILSGSLSYHACAYHATFLPRPSNAVRDQRHKNSVHVYTSKSSDDLQAD